MNDKLSKNLANTFNSSLIILAEIKLNIWNHTNKLNINVMWRDGVVDR